MTRRGETEHAPGQPSRDLDREGALADLLDGVQDPLRGLLRELLMYKVLFAGKGFEELGAASVLGSHSETFRRLARETRDEMREAAERLREWSDLPQTSDRLDQMAEQVRRRLFEDLVALKEGSNEVFLAVAMAAPNERLRQELVKLADLDRRHADELREVNGALRLAAALHRMRQGGEGKALGAHSGRNEDESLGRSIETALETFRSNGAMPARLVVSPTALRHLRDERRLDEKRGTFENLAVEIDFAWEGECFAIGTDERIGMSEIITATQTGNVERGA